MSAENENKIPGEEIVDDNKSKRLSSTTNVEVSSVGGASNKNNALQGATSENKNVQKSVSNSSFASASAIAEGMASNLICSICTEIFHDPYNVSPCNHVFCGGCLSQWIKQQDHCPTCRERFTTISFHHMISNMVSTFYETNPNRRRNQEEITLLNGMNTLPRNTSYQSKNFIFK